MDKNIVLYGAGEIGKKNYEFLKMHGMGQFIIAWCDKNYEYIGDIDGIPIQPYESSKSMDCVYIISARNGMKEIVQMLESDKKKYYMGMLSWIYECFEGKDRLSLYTEYSGEQNIQYENSLERYEGRVRARLFLHTYSSQSILKAEDVVKIGSNYGGWVIPRKFELDTNDYVLCAGAGEDISFDCGMAAEYKCNVVTIDPTPRAIAHYTGLKNAILNDHDYYTNVSDEKYKYNIVEDDFRKIRFLPYGIADKKSVFKFYFPQNEEYVSCSIVNLQNTDKYFEAECLTYPMLLEKLNISGFKLIKLDIEGAEYGVIKSIYEANNCPPQLLCVDFDETNHALDINAAQRIKNTMEVLESYGMLPIWIEGDSVTFGLVRPANHTRERCNAR